MTRFPFTEISKTQWDRDKNMYTIMDISAIITVLLLSIYRNLRICSHLLNKSLMENFHFLGSGMSEIPILNSLNTHENLRTNIVNNKINKIGKYSRHTKQVQWMFPRFLNSRLNLSKHWQFLTYIGQWFHETVHLNRNELIPKRENIVFGKMSLLH